MSASLSSSEQWVGFDLDHTLVRYRLQPLLSMIDRGFRSFLFQKLTERYTTTWSCFEGKTIEELPFDMGYCRRGVVFDLHTGDLLSLGKQGQVLVAFHGRTRRTPEQIAALYTTDTPWRGFGFLESSQKREDFLVFSEAFGLGTLYGIILCVDFVDATKDHPVLRDYAAIGHVATEYYQGSFDWTNLSALRGSYYPHILRDPGKYIYHRPEFVPYLHNLRKQGKKLFLCTNSHFDYCNFLLRFLLSPSPERGEDDTRDSPAVLREALHVPSEKEDPLHWWNLFDVSFTYSCKPGFFLDSSRATREIDRSEYAEKGFEYWEALEKTPEVAVKDVELDGRKVYLGGSAAVFHRVTHPKNVTYLGDHLMSDFHACLAIGWNGVAVIEDDDPCNEALGIHFGPRLMHSEGYWRSRIVDRGVPVWSDALHMGR